MYKVKIQKKYFKCFTILTNFERRNSFLRYFTLKRAAKENRKQRQLPNLASVA